MKKYAAFSRKFHPPDPKPTPSIVIDAEATIEDVIPSTRLSTMNASTRARGDAGGS